MNELANYIPKVRQIFAKTIDEYNFEVHLTGDREITISNSKCVMKFTTGRYYVDFGVEFFDPKTSNIRNITMREILLEQGLIGKDIANKKELEFFGKFTDEIERKLHETYFLLKYCKKYLEGNFSFTEKE